MAAQVPELSELVPFLLESSRASFLDHVAKGAGYDPSSAAILSALTTDYVDATNPANRSGPMLTREQAVSHMQNRKLLETLIDHYGKRFGKTQKKGDEKAPEPGRLAPEQLRDMT